ncbi:MAG: hypothetical protein ACK5Q5_16705, partial [Planctomycetaceae bacterium]
MFPLLDHNTARMTDARVTANDPTETLREVRLWIDGVGCWMLWLPEVMTIGGPHRRGSMASLAADLPLLADLRSRHATIERIGE